ncbi:MAG: alpha-L-rhamnosidase C-terminal domain-containing protein [Bacteroidota bacterium]
MTSASAEYQTYYGKIKSAWKVEGGKVTLDVEIPANTKATVVVPGGETVEVGIRCLLVQLRG